jgi:ABC-2 type transport system permease protein
MNDLGLTAVQTRYSLQGFLRDPRALILTVIMPVFLVLILNTVFRGRTTFDGLRVPFGSYYTASITSYVVMMTGFGSLMVSVTAARERGLLKRFRGTPMPGWVYLSSEILQNVVVVAATVIVLVAVGMLFYRVRLSGNMVEGLVVYVLVGTACFSSLGLAASRVTTTTDAASAFGPFSTVVLSFISGVFVPVALMPSWLVSVGKVFPLEHVAHGLQSAFLVPGSTGITAMDVGVLAAWGVAGMLVAMRAFRWDAIGTST